jgi:hypothetical protein
MKLKQIVHKMPEPTWLVWKFKESSRADFRVNISGPSILLNIGNNLLRFRYGCWTHAFTFMDDKEWWLYRSQKEAEAKYRLLCNCSASNTAED